VLARKAVRFVRESMSNRLNDEPSAIIVIMQRLHANDVSGDILAREANYCHMMVPMYFDPLRYPVSADGTATEDPETGKAFEGNDIGWIDPRACNDPLSPREYGPGFGDAHHPPAEVGKARAAGLRYTPLASIASAARPPRSRACARLASSATRVPDGRRACGAGSTSGMRATPKQKRQERH
jgi:hypothetical protein